MTNSKLDLRTISKRAIKGAVSLIFRRVALQAISFITINLVLAKMLPVATLGIFNISTAVVSFFSFFSDIGLAAAIIQKKGEVTLDDLRTTFTIQQLLLLFLVLIIWFMAPFFVSSYGLEENGMWLIRALGLSFFITGLKVIPSVLLERDLKFNPLVGIEIFETLTFNLILIVLVIFGFDLTAFSYAALARSVIGVAMIYLIAPWKVSIGISKISAKSLLSFGLPFQLNALLALLKDRLVPLVIAGMIGPLGMGYVTWSQNLAFLPLEVMNIIIRVSFPTFSRLQDDKVNLKQALEKSLFITTLFLYPGLFGMVVLAPFLVEYVVSSKWVPALPLFYLFSISTFWATLSTTFTNALNAIGHIRTTLKLMILWTVLTWLLTPLITSYYGFIGVALSSAVISFSSVITIYLIKKFVDVSIISNIWQPFVASLAMSAVVFILANFLVKDWLSLIFVIACGAIIYFGFMMLIGREKLLSNLVEVKNAFSST